MTELSAEGLQEILPVIGARVFAIEKADGAPDPLRSNVQSPTERNKIFTNHGALEPPYDPALLGELYDHSVALRPNVDAYATNIDSFGHRFEPISDPDHNGEPGSQPDDDSADPEDAKPDEPTPVDPETKAAIDKEKRELKRFFDYCCVEQSFAELRQMTRQDIEAVGNGYWEVLRNIDAKVTQFVYMPGFAVRLLPVGEQVEIQLKILDEDGTPTTVTRYRRFRRFIQLIGNNRVVFFKEFGDARLMSATTGLYYKDIQSMAKAEDGKTAVATEVKHFKIHSPKTPYGVPRWIGALISVMGSRMAEEVNFAYFDNKAVPPLAILVSGGRVGEDTVKRLQDYVQSNLKGRANFHKILIIEAEPAAGVAASDQSGKVKIELRPLTAAQHNDAQFQNYDERNIDKVGSMFRLPRLLRGDARDFNRATASSALDFAEMQVFQPARQSFDFTINREFLADMGVRYWKFVSLAPVTRDPSAMSDILRNVVNAGILVPGEARKLLEDVFNCEFATITAPWTKQPLALTLAGMAGGMPGAANGKPQGGADGVPGGDETDPGDASSESAQKRFLGQILQLRKSLEEAEREAFETAMANRLTKMNKRLAPVPAAELETQVIRIPAADMKQILEGPDAAVRAEAS